MVNPRKARRASSSKSCSDCSKTAWHSWNTGSMAKGCMLCVKGKKLVLFITGLCGQRCFYCPISEKKFGSDVVYANEWNVPDPGNPAELIEEALLTEAKGAGITGGDPLVKIDRCCDYIRLLKKRFGKGFHIHLYTPLLLVTPKNLKKLHDAGLDEIRFHPDLDNDALWNRLSFAKTLSWDVGVEIPAVPGYEKRTMKLIDFIAGDDGKRGKRKKLVDFLNLNELERSDTSAAHYLLDKNGFKQKDPISYGVKGSAAMAMEMMEYARKQGLAVHFCTAKLKDSVQLKQRIIRRSKNVKLHFDTKTKDGTLVRGTIYLSALYPTFGYRSKLNGLDAKDRKKFINALSSVHSMLVKKFKLPRKDVVVDEVKLRLLVPASFIKKNADSLKSISAINGRKQKLVPAIVEEYPTRDAMEVEVEFL